MSTFVFRLALACVTSATLVTSCTSSHPLSQDDETPDLRWSISQRNEDKSVIDLVFYSNNLGRTVGYEVDRIDSAGVLFKDSGNLTPKEFNELHILTSKSAIEDMKRNLRPASDTQTPNKSIVGDIFLVSTMIECTPLPECATRFEAEIMPNPPNRAVTALQNFAHAFVLRHPGTKAIVLSNGTSTVP